MANQDTSLQIFDFQSKQVRTVTKDNEPWFVAADVCEVLDHSNSRKAVERLDDDEKGVTTVYTSTGEKEVNIVSESGLYSLIFTSRKPEAKAFKKWVTSEVLPAIRKTGGYGAAEAVLANEPLSPTQQQQIKAVINARLNPTFRQAGSFYMYGKLKRHFGVEAWVLIRRGDFAAAMELLTTADGSDLLLNNPPRLTEGGGAQ